MAQGYRLGNGLASFFHAISDEADQSALGRVVNARQEATQEQVNFRTSQEELERARAINEARAGLAEAFQSMGYDPRESQGLASVFVGGDYDNLANAGSFLRDYQDIGQERTAVDRFSQGDTGLANLMLATAGQEPLEMTQVNEGVAFNPNLTPERTPLRQTPAHKAETLADILMNREDNQTDKTINQADNAAGSGFKPITGTLADAFLAPITNEDGEPVRNPITGEIEMQFDTQRFQDFLIWQNQSGIPDQNQALAVYLAQEGSQATIDPVLAAAQRAIVEKGKSPDAVRQVLEARGYSEVEINKAIGNGE